MNDDRKSSMTRLATQPFARREVLGALVLGAVSLAVPGKQPAVAQTTSSSDASTLVLSFYENLDAYRYEQAFELLGKTWQTQQSLETFIAGYTNTAFVQCVTGATGRARNGDQLVPVELVSWQNDGEIVAYDGTYTVGIEDGDLVIAAGDITPVALPAGTLPLCGVDDMAFAFGPWDAAAGSRNGAIIGTNTGGSSCVVGGSPRITLTDGSGNVLRSTSREGSPPIGIVLEPAASAQAPLRFADWCGDTSAPASIVIDLPGSSATGTVDPIDHGVSYPPCLGENQAALMEITGWVADPA